MKKPEEIIPDSEIEKVHAYADFGDISKRDVVNYGVLKAACGYHQGYTARQICLEHGLMSKKTENITKKGRQYLWAVFGKISV